MSQNDASGYPPSPGESQPGPDENTESQQAQVAFMSVSVVRRKGTSGSSCTGRQPSTFRNLLSGVCLRQGNGLSGRDVRIDDRCPAETIVGRPES
jgi:hypothetical protein